MSQNPYATPSAPLGHPSPSGRPGVGGSGKIDLGETLAEAWNAMTEHWAVAIGGYLLFMLLAGISIATCIGAVLLVPVFTWGISALTLNIVDGDAEIGDLFAGFNRYGDALLANLIVMFASILLSLPSVMLQVGAVALDVPSLNSLGMLVGWIIALTVTVRLYLAPFYIVDQEMGGMEALRASWEATQDQRLTVILLVIVSSLVAFAGIIVLLIGVLFTAPMAMVMWAVAYRQLEPLEAGGPAAPPNQGYSPGYPPPSPHM